MVNPYTALAAPPDVPMQQAAPLPAGLSMLPAAPGYRQPGPNPYQTQLAPADEAKFQQWVKANKVPFDPSPTSDYDMRGFWLANQGQMTGTQAKSDGLHYPDTYKTPYHHSFSNESIYSPSDGPRWQGSDASGWKLVDKNGRVVYDESNVQTLGAQQK